MFNALTGLGWGVVTFAITIGVGTVVLSKFGAGVAVCPYGAMYYNETGETCHEIIDPTNSSDPTNAGWTTTQYMNTQLGTSGLAGWAPAIIAFAVGMLFLGGFMVNKGKGRSY